jgi:hypothetical protein
VDDLVEGDFGATTIVDPAIQEIEGTDDPGWGIRAMAPFGERLDMTLLFPSVRERGLTIKGDLVEVNENQTPRGSAHAGLKLGHLG